LEGHYAGQDHQYDYRDRNTVLVYRCASQVHRIVCHPVRGSEPADLRE
jgi:hypothetical protein